MKDITKVLAKAPKIEDISKVGSKKVMFSIKSKRKVADYAITHSLKPSVLAKMYPKVTSTMLNCWVRDHKENKFKSSNAISISRR